MKKTTAVVFYVLSILVIRERVVVGGVNDLPVIDEIINDLDSISSIDKKNEEVEKNLDFPMPKNVGPDVEMTTPQMIRKEGYPAEAHVVLTEDGYLLTVHRIPASDPASPTVFLQHGLLCSSADWVIAGRNKGLAFILADLGYDVWMGNARGNTYSRSHLNYTTSDRRFWNFSWHEMGVFDLPAVISYITHLKNGTISYVGHSMGTTMFYVMASERPEFTSKINIMFSLAPVAFMDHIKSPVRLLVPFIREVELVIRYLGEGEFLPQNKILKFLAKYGCDIDVTEEKICANMLFVIAGFDETEFNFTLMPLILSHVPAGASTKTLIHYAQEIKSGRFQRYDYGAKNNLGIYNSTTPPDYDLSKIQVPVEVFYADNDWLSSPIDVHRLYDRLPNKIAKYRVNYPKFNHLDFLWAIDAPRLVYKEILSVLKKYTNV